MVNYGVVRMRKAEPLHESVGALNSLCTTLTGLSYEVGDAVSERALLSKLRFVSAGGVLCSVTESCRMITVVRIVRGRDRG